MQIVHTILKVWRETLDILFAEHINTLYSACQVYIKAESSEKIGNLKDIKFLLFQLSVDKGCRMCYQRGNSNNIDLS